MSCKKTGVWSREKDIQIRRSSKKWTLVKESEVLEEEWHMIEE